jgi:Zn-dependent M32 family carboxypeptidase
MMPPKGNDARGKQMAALAGILHEKKTNSHLGQLIQHLLVNDTSNTLNEWEQAVVR